jgi:hypothetical protein
MAEYRGGPFDHVPPNKGAMGIGWFKIKGIIVTRLWEIFSPSVLLRHAEN